MKVDAAAIALETCKEFLALKRDDIARTCLQNITQEHPNSPEAAKASALLLVLAPAPATTVEPAPAPEAEEDNVYVTSGGLKFTFELGRLEMAATGGLVGVATGPMVASIIGLTEADINSGILTLGGGLLSVGLGAGMASAGYFLTDNKYFGATPGRFGTSGMVYGTTVGIATGAILASAVSDDFSNLSLQLGLASTLLGAYGGIATGLFVGKSLNYSEANATYISVVGSMGMILGGLVLPNIAAFDPDAPGWAYGVTYLGVSGIGVVGAAATAKMFDFTTVESLIAGGGAIAGLMVMVPLSATASFQISDDPKVAIPLTTGGIALGMVGGYTALPWPSRSISVSVLRKTARHKANPPSMLNPRRWALFWTKTKTPCRPCKRCDCVGNAAL